MAVRKLKPVTPGQRHKVIGAGLHDLTTPKMHSPHIAIRLVGSYPTFSPLPNVTVLIYMPVLSLQKNRLWNNYMLMKSFT